VRLEPYEGKLSRTVLRRERRGNPPDPADLQMELQAYRDDLEIRPEYSLTAEPLKIDCVVIKKAKDAVIKKNIAVIFREWNLIEYKSPTSNRTA
jgi:hypothetical protein